MSDELFASEFVFVPRQKGQCEASALLREAGYVERATTPGQADKVYHQIHDISPWSAERVFVKDGRMYVFDRWSGHKDKDGWKDPDAVIIRDVTALLTGAE